MSDRVKDGIEDVYENRQLQLDRRLIMGDAVLLDGVSVSNKKKDNC